MNVVGFLIDWAERIARSLDDLESRAAGSAEPDYAVSDRVTVSRDEGIYTYHLADDQLGQGSSLGNLRTWVETKGTGDMLRFWSIDAGACVIGGMSITYQMPFADLSPHGTSSLGRGGDHHSYLSRAMPAATGTIHLHPAYQQREFVIGDGLHVIETLYVPSTGDADDPCAVCVIVSLKNRTPHPIGISVVGSLQLRGETARDVEADYDDSEHVLVAWNRSSESQVRVFGCDVRPDGYLATTDEEEAYSPGHDLPSEITGSDDLTGALQHDIRLLSGQSRKVRFIVAFSPRGREEAIRQFRRARRFELRETVVHYAGVLHRAVVEMPDMLLTQGMQWAKTCLLRVLAGFPTGTAFTNDPGNSSHIVGRDVAWYVHGCDFVLPRAACSMLDMLAERQREDGLIAEYIDGITGEAVDHNFNINDDTPLFVMAVAHHLKATGHPECMERLYEPARRAVELILSQRDDRGLILCTNDGMGIGAICGWRNVLTNEQITGVVTEVNAECYMALCSFMEIAEMKGDAAEAARIRAESQALKAAINRHLINPRNGLYVRNIDLRGNVFTEATIDLVFPMISGVAEDEQVRAIAMRLSEPDFMTAGGVRALPSENPRYDPAKQSGCLGGVWPGATWWYSMGCRKIHPKAMADSLRSSYRQYVIDPKTYNTVPGQFSEWSDGQTLVNRGMRLSPWEAPRFLWAAIEGLAGIIPGSHEVTVAPALPPDWNWLRIGNLHYRDTYISFFLTVQHNAILLYTACPLRCGNEVEFYDEELPASIETIVPGLSATMFRREGEMIICLGNCFATMIFGPFLAHHTVKSGTRYRVHRLHSMAQEWEDLGERDGAMLQLVTVRIEPQGYVLYRLVSVEG